MKKIFLVLFLIPFVSICQEQAKIMGGCSAPLSSNFLDINNISTQVFTGGDMNWDIFGGQLPNYQFPKGSFKPAAGAASIWIGGLDVNGQLKIAGQTYRQSGLDYWPGPLNSLDASIDQSQCFMYDNVWKVSYTDINNFIEAFNRGDIQDATSPIPYGILNWPTAFTDIHGYTQKLAPFVDSNNDGKYNPKADGDYPDIHGDQTLYYIFNDNGGVHQSTGGKSIGVQINATAYAYGCPEILKGRNELNNTTFYNYKIYNRSSYTINQVYISVWVDATIGNGNDDYVGSNPKNSYAFAYNGTANDAIYGNILPATGTVILKAPKAPINDGIDNDNDSIIDEPNEELLIPQISYFLRDYFGQANSPIQMREPQNATQFYQYMKGYWRDGTIVTCGGNGYGGSKPTKYVFPGINSLDTSCISNWTEQTANNVSGNRCYLLNMGPFTFNAYDSTEIEFAFVTSVDSNSIGNTLGSINKLENDIIKVKDFYNITSKPNCLSKINYVPDYSITSQISIFPNPTNGVLNFNSLKFKNKTIPVTFTDVLGQKVLDVELTGKANSVDISFLASGIYFVNFTVASKPQKIKLIKL